MAWAVLAPPLHLVEAGLESRAHAGKTPEGWVPNGLGEDLNIESGTGEATASPPLLPLPELDWVPCLAQVGVEGAEPAKHMEKTSPAPLNVANKVLFE
eukprot:11695786-Alexandrium_andersonii.AAC.1